MKRKISAIMCADVVGYSRLVSEDEEEALRRLLSYRTVFETFVTDAGGRIFNTAGDAVLAEFPSAVDAVRAAVDIQESLRTRNVAYPKSRQMMFRIGITIGDVVEQDGDLLGDAVNIAARLQTLSEAGGICLSQAVREQVANKMSAEFRDLGPQNVKNIPQEIRAFTIEFARGADDDASDKPAKARRFGLVAFGGIAAVLLIVAGAAGYAFLDRGAMTVSDPQPPALAAPEKLLSVERPQPEKQTTIAAAEPPPVVRSDPDPVSAARPPAAAVVPPPAAAPVASAEPTRPAPATTVAEAPAARVEAEAPAARAEAKAPAARAEAEAVTAMPPVRTDSPAQPPVTAPAEPAALETAAADPATASPENDVVATPAPAPPAVTAPQTPAAPAPAPPAVTAPQTPVAPAPQAPPAPEALAAARPPSKVVPSAAPEVVEAAAPPLVAPAADAETETAMVAPAQADQQSSRDPAVPRPRPQPSYVYVDMAGRDYAADLVPFVCDRCRSKMARGYDGGGKYKALAVNTSGDVGWSSGHKSEQAARKSAVSYCSDRNGRECEVFAVNGTIVWTHPAPVLPDRPWVRADDAGRPFDAAGLVTLKEQARATLAKKYGSAPNPKAIAVSSGGAWSYFTNGASEDEVMRQALEVCSHFGEEVCVIAALNDRLVNGGGAGEGAGSTAHAD